MANIKIQRKGITRIISEQSWALLSAKQKAEWEVVDPNATAQPKAIPSFIPPEIKALKSNPNVVEPIPVGKGNDVPVGPGNDGTAQSNEALFPAEPIENKAPAKKAKSNDANKK